MKISLKSIMIGLGISIILISGIYLHSDFNKKANNINTNKLETKSLKLQVIDRDTKIKLSAYDVTYTCDYEVLPSIESNFTADTLHEGYIYLRDLEIFLSRLEEGTNQTIKRGINSGVTSSYSWVAISNKETNNWQLNLDLLLNSVPLGKGIHIKEDVVCSSPDGGIYIPVKFLSDLGLPIIKNESLN